MVKILEWNLLSWVIIKQMEQLLIVKRNGGFVVLMDRVCLETQLYADEGNITKTVKQLLVISAKPR